MVMTREKFLLTSDQLELLLIFEESSSLQELSDKMHKDQSVISRQLQKLNEDYPVIFKEKRKWVISPLGIEINKITRDMLRLLKNELKPLSLQETIKISESAIIVINAQKALLETKIDRSNPIAERNISAVLKCWREIDSNIIHVKHISDSTGSAFYRASESSRFMSDLGPIDNEQVIEKKNASSFYQTGLNEILRKKNITNLFLMGFTANECIEATAKDASELGFSVHVIGDATAMFDFMGHDKTLYKAEKVHSLILANIHQLYAKVIDTHQMITIPLV